MFNDSGDNQGVSKTNSNTNSAALSSVVDMAHKRIRIHSNFVSSGITPSAELKALLIKELGSMRKVVNRNTGKHKYTGKTTDASGHQSDDLAVCLLCASFWGLTSTLLAESMAQNDQTGSLLDMPYQPQESYERPQHRPYGLGAIQL